LLAAIIAVSIAVNISSCKKNSVVTKTVDTTGTVTEADVAQFTADAVSPSSGGMADQLSSSTIIYATNALSCGVQKDSTIIKASAAGAVPAYDYTFSWTYMLNCSGLIQNNITFNYTGIGSYNGTRLSAIDTANAQIVLTGAQSSYLLTFDYTRTGIVTNKLVRQYTFTTTLNIQSADVTIDKTTHEITSGIATVAIVSTSTSGKKFNFGGKLTFLGNKKGSLVLNSGATYAIQWL